MIRFLCCRLFHGAQIVGGAEIRKRTIDVACAHKDN